MHALHALTRPPHPPAALAAALVLNLAKGFARPTKKARGPNNPDNPDNPAASKDVKRLRGKLVPCQKCRGKGKKICQFCEGSKRMSGFLGNRVPCIPCEETGVMPRPCADCNGMGFFQP